MSAWPLPRNTIDPVCTESPLRKNASPHGDCHNVLPGTRHRRRLEAGAPTRLAARRGDGAWIPGRASLARDDGRVERADRDDNWSGSVLWAARERSSLCPYRQVAMPRPPSKSTMTGSRHRMAFAPGAETTWHRHGYDYVVVPMTTGKLQIDDGKNAAIRGTDGRAVVLPSGRHRAQRHQRQRVRIHLCRNRVQSTPRLTSRTRTTARPWTTGASSAVRSMSPSPPRNRSSPSSAKARAPVGKREIARAFHLKGADRIPLKALLKELEKDGQVDRGRNAAGGRRPAARGHGGAGDRPRCRRRSVGAAGRSAPRRCRAEDRHRRRQEDRPAARRRRPRAGVAEAAPMPTSTRRAPSAGWRAARSAWSACSRRARTASAASRPTDKRIKTEFSIHPRDIGTARRPAIW